MDLNYIWDQFLNSYKLAFHKEKKDITKFKLMKVTVQQVTDETDILFDQNFGYNKFTFLEFKNNKEFRKIIKHEVDILKKKTASSKKSLNWPLNTEVDFLFPKYIYIERSDSSCRKFHSEYRIYSTYCLPKCRYFNYHLL